VVPGRGQLLGTLAVLLATAAALALAGVAGREAPGGAPALASETPKLARLSVSLTPEVARRVERLRELEFGHLPRAAVVDGDYLRGLTRRELRRSGRPRALAADEATVRMVGLLAPEERLGPALTASGDLAAAAYDTETDRLYVVRDAVGESPAMVEFVLAHELTHALEDASFGLAEPGGGSDDRALAALALGEGTATTVMIDYAAGFLDPVELLAATAAVDGDTGDVPTFVVEQLEWTYLGGRQFIDALRELGGGWTLVDYAIESRPPASTEQVLHPRRYIQDERPLEVEIDAQALDADGWRRATGGDIGEYATRQLLELGAPAAMANRAANGWGGDRYELWRREVAPSACADSCHGDLVLVLRWRWDTDGDARQFELAARRYVAAALDGALAGSNAWTLPSGAAALDRRADATTLVLAPDLELARGVAVTGSAP
jgi:hypothetical protein